MALVPKAALYPFQAAVLCCGSANMSSRWMAAVVLQKVAEGLNFDFGSNCLRVKGKLTSKTQNTLLTAIDLQ